MATLDIFRNPAFGLSEMADAYEKIDYVPSILNSMNLFTPLPLRTTTFWMESRDSGLTLIPTSPRGAPPAQRETEKRSARALPTFRIAKDDTLMASELLDVRAFGKTSELQAMQEEIDRRLSGPAGMIAEVQYTFENMQLGAVTGLMVDADGSTLVNFYTNLGVTQPAEINFALAAAQPAEGALMLACMEVTDRMRRAAKGEWRPGAVAVGLCSDGFWKALITHSEARKTWELMLQGGFRDGLDGLMGNIPRVRIGDVVFIRYWGSDDDTVKIATDKVKFFPMGIPGLFRHVMAPGESFAHLRRPGQAVYPMILPDKSGADEWVKLCVRAYPLMFCRRPEMLQSGRK
ncbi:major capsid protein [Thiocapsa sp.]|uniref:major capsid protein n=1 Tax=Thiocapsa sp. TaxID=2024551 RepID=UPI0025D96D25|nr:major capsid protein [Thiocapsa sp.]